MSIQQTLGIIKPDAVDARHIGQIVAMIEKTDLSIVGLKLIQMDRKVAEGFYGVHKGKKFFKSLMKYITSGPVLVMALNGENAIEKWRKLMGPTDSTKAPKSSIRGKFGTDIEANAVHGSDAPETAAFEISYFFNAFELVTPGRKK